MTVKRKQKADRAIDHVGPVFSSDEMVELMDGLAHAADRLELSYSETSHLTRQAALTIRALKDELHATKCAIRDTVGGVVEGQPTGTHNYLQRLRALIFIEREAERVSMAMDRLVRALRHGSGEGAEHIFTCHNCQANYTVEGKHDRCPVCE